MFLKNPPVLILDEGTSALDNISERKVRAAIDQARQQQMAAGMVQKTLYSTEVADKVTVESRRADASFS